MLIRKLWYVYYTLLYINKKLLHSSIKLPPPPAGGGSGTVTLGKYDISKIVCSVSEKKEKNHKIFIFTFSSETEKLDNYDYIAIAYQGEVIKKISLENCDYEISYEYEDLENKIDLPNEIEIFIIPEEEKGDENGLLFSFS